MQRTQYFYFQAFYLIANKSTISITGSLASNSEALAIKAAAIGPLRCAMRPSIVSKVSKIPKVEGPICKAYHLIVPGSPWVNGNAYFKNSGTSFSLPGLVSALARIANFSMTVF